MKLSGCAWLYLTTLIPENVPIAAPRATSLAQWALLYIRESPTSVAPPYITGATIHCSCGHQRRDSLVTAAAAANATVECPDGKDAYCPPVNPRPNLKSCGFVSRET